MRQIGYFHEFVIEMYGQQYIKKLPFIFPMVWKELKTTHPNCYVSVTNITEINSESKRTVQYPNLPSAMRLVSHSEKLTVPKPPENKNFSDDNWYWWRWRATRRGQCWLRFDLRKNLFLVWTSIYMISIYLLTAIGLSPGGRSTVQYSTVQYTFTHKEYTERYKTNNT